MAFEIFTRKVQWRGVPSVTFTKMGRFAFNKAATEKLEENAVEDVLLLWDAGKRIIGVRPITKRDSRSYKLRPGKRGNGSGFSSATFFQYIGYDYSDSRSFPAKWDEDEGIFLIEVPAEHLKQKQVGLGLVGTSTT